MPDIMKAVFYMVETALDDTHGYDQQHRNSPDFDCSSLVATALCEAGFNVSPASWTGNLESQLRKCDFTDCEQPWKAGDIHLKIGKHVAMSIDTIGHIVHARSNEKGTATGGQTGDQTGNEICISNYYEYPGGWSCHLRYTDKSNELLKVAKDVIAGKYGNGEERKKALESLGYDYRKVQSLVNDLL